MTPNRGTPKSDMRPNVRVIPLGSHASATTFDVQQSCRLEDLRLRVPLHFLVDPQEFLSTLEVGGENRSEAEDPHRESKPSAHAPAPHARHDRSMARNVWRLGRSEAYFPPLRACHENMSRVHGRVHDLISFILARNYNGFLVDQLVDQLS